MYIILGLFVSVNCGAISPTYADAELFGYAAGAHSSSASSRAGWFGSANGGTLYLDEIGDLPLAYLEHAYWRPAGLAAPSASACCSHLTVSSASAHLLTAVSCSCAARANRAHCGARAGRASRDVFCPPRSAACHSQTLLARPARCSATPDPARGEAPAPPRAGATPARRQLLKSASRPRPSVRALGFVDPTLISASQTPPHVVQ